jgi:hypothetical protein
MKDGNEEVRAEMSVVWGGTEKSHVVRWSGSSFFHSLSFVWGERRLCCAELG